MMTSEQEKILLTIVNNIDLDESQIRVQRTPNGYSVLVVHDGCRHYFLGKEYYDLVTKWAKTQMVDIEKFVMVAF